jgi:hypothetical protein
MPTLMPWTTIEIGDVDIFSPSLRQARKASE